MCWEWWEFPRFPKFPKLIPKNSQIAQTLIYQPFPLGIWLGIVWEWDLGWEWWEFPRFPKFPKLIPKAFPKKFIYKTENYGWQNFLYADLFSNKSKP